VDRFNQEHPAIQVESLYVGEQQLPKILAAVEVRRQICVV